MKKSAVGAALTTGELVLDVTGASLLSKAGKAAQGLKAASEIAGAEKTVEAAVAAEKVVSAAVKTKEVVVAAVETTEKVATVAETATKATGIVAKTVEVVKHAKVGEGEVGVKVAGVELTVGAKGGNAEIKVAAKAGSIVKGEVAVALNGDNAGQVGVKAGAGLGDVVKADVGTKINGDGRGDIKTGVKAAGGLATVSATVDPTKLEITKVEGGTKGDLAVKGDLKQGTIKIVKNGKNGVQIDGDGVKSIGAAAPAMDAVAVLRDNKAMPGTTAPMVAKGPQADQLVVSTDKPTKAATDTQAKPPQQLQVAAVANQDMGTMVAKTGGAGKGQAPQPGAGIS
jgi:hypothetical protein